MSYYANFNRYVSPYFQYADETGTPLPYAQLFFYATGTTTPKNTYADKLMMTANPNPVIADGSGYFDLYGIFYDEGGDYHVQLKDQFGNLVWDADPVSGTQLWGLIASVAMLNSTNTACENESADYDAIPSDWGKTILMDASGGARTVTLLPAITAGNGWRCWVKKVDASMNIVTVVVEAGGTIDGAADIVLNSQWDVVQLVSNGYNYFLQAVQQQDLGGESPVGTVSPYGGFFDPTNLNWILTNGRALSRTTYSQLLSVITFSQACTLAASSTNVTVADSNALFVGLHVEGNGIIAGTTVASIVDATHITISQVASITGSSSLTFFPWGNGDGSTTFNIPNTQQGRFTIGAVNGTYPAGSYGGTTTYPIIQANLPAFAPTITITDPSHAHQSKISDAGGSGIQGGSGIGNQVSQVATTTSTTGITATCSVLGSGTPLAIIPPYQAYNSIIRIE